MKKTFLLIAFFATIAITVASCKNGRDDTPKKNTTMDETTPGNYSSAKDTSHIADADVNTSIEEMVRQYLQIKNALVNDNGQDAARAANAFVASMGTMEKTSLKPEKNKIWDNLSDDAKEMAEHIGSHGDDIEHQREHFDMLSEDMYDLVKTFGAGRTLYRDFCPMYNNNKGATWLSETKEIKNPYLGKKMLTCGSVKAEIK